MVNNVLYNVFDWDNNNKYKYKLFVFIECMSREMKMRYKFPFLRRTLKKRLTLIFGCFQCLVFFVTSCGLNRKCFKMLARSSYASVAVVN